MILDIIAVDHRCAQAVKDAKKKRQDTTADMNSKKKEIYDSFVKEYQVTLDARRKSYRKELTQQRRRMKRIIILLLRRSPAFMKPTRRSGLHLS